MNEEFVSVTVQFLGRSFVVKCRSDEHAPLQQAVDFLNKKMLEVQKKTNTAGFEQVAVITALNLANEAIQSKNQNNDLLHKVNQKLSGLQEKLDEALHQNKQAEFSYVLD